MSLPFELKQDGKWYEREVYFLFLSHFLSAAVNRNGQILMEVHPPSMQHSYWDYYNLLLLVRGRRRGRIDYCVVKCICDAFPTIQSKGYLAAQVLPQPLGHFISYSHAISFVDNLLKMS